MKRLKELRDEWQSHANDENAPPKDRWEEGFAAAERVIADKLDALIQEGSDIASAIPTNWCDPLLTGENAVIGSPPYDCKDIERLLSALRNRAAGKKE